MSEQSDRLRAGDWYLDDADLRGLRNLCWRLLDRFNASGADEDDERARLLGELLGTYGAGAVVMPGSSAGRSASRSATTSGSAPA